MKIQKYNKAIYGGITAGLAAFVVAIQVVTGDSGMVVEAAWNVSGQEWATIFGAILVGGGLIAAAPANKP